MSNPSDNATSRTITDSPWFWSLLFCAFGMVLLLAFSGNISRRQARLELQYQAHEEKARRQVTGQSAARAAGDEGSAAPPGELIIPLGPVLAIFAGLLVLSAVMLWRSRHVAVPPASRESP